MNIVEPALWPGPGPGESSNGILPVLAASLPEGGLKVAHTYESLKPKTLAELREIAAGVKSDAVQGYTQMNKEHLLRSLCKALNIEMHAHHEVAGLNKADIKAQIRGLKAERDAALSGHDHSELKVIRRKIHRLKRRIHKATV
jgi:hypothetical protein